MKETTIATARKAKNIHPREDCPKVWTEEMMPLRVMKVPKMVRRKVSVISTIFQTFSIPRFSWIITEWR